MLVSLIYGVPTWEMAVLVVAVTVAVSLLVLLLFSRFIPIDLRRQHNDLVGFNSAMVGVVFAVLLAFIAVAAWESFDKAGDAAATEAALTGDLFRDALEMPEPLKTELLGEVRDYVQIVLTKEWPAMANGADFGDEGWAPLIKFHRSLASLKTSDPVQVAMFSEVLSRLNQLYDARRDRILVAEDHIAPMVWWVMVLGAVVSIVFTCLYGMESFAMHVWMTVGVAASLALVVALIIAFDYPFRGEVQIGPDGFVNVRHNMETAGINFGDKAP